MNQESVYYAINACQLVLTVALIAAILVGRGRKKAFPDFKHTPPPPKMMWRRLKAHELVKGEIYTDRLSRCPVRVFKVGPGFGGMPNSGRGVLWNDTTGEFTAIDIDDDQLEVLVPNDRPELPDREPTRP